MATQGERKAETRARLLSAAATVFADLGIEGASVDAIAETAGRTSGALYAHFGSKEGLLIDGRPADRFRGENEIIDPVAGHIPGAVSVPARSLVDAHGRFLPAEQLREVLGAAGIDGSVPVATYCGSGVQASHLALAIAVAGIDVEVPVYIGSWSDWISDASRPVQVETPAESAS